MYFYLFTSKIGERSAVRWCVGGKFYYLANGVINILEPKLHVGDEKLQFLRETKKKPYFLAAFLLLVCSIPKLPINIDLRSHNFELYL